MSKKLKIGLIGAGGIAQGLHMPAYAHFAEMCEMVAVCDINEIPNYYKARRRDLRRIGWYMTTRGCRNGCDYCLWARQPMRQKSRAKVLEELQTLIERTELRRLMLFDFDLFDLYRDDPALLEAIAALVRRRSSEFALNLWTNPASIADPNLRRWVERLAVNRVIVGLQTGRRDVACAAHRPWFGSWVDPFLAVEESLRSRFVVELIYPLPGETPASFRRTVERLLGLGYYGLRVFHLMVLRGTQLRRRAADLGLRYLDRPPYFCTETPTSSPAETLRIGRLGFVLTLLTSVLDGVRDADAVRRWFVADRGRIVGRLLAGLDRGLHPDEIVRREVRSICEVGYPGSFVLGQYKGPPETAPPLHALLDDPARPRGADCRPRVRVGAARPRRTSR
jgi:hypothetical protein